MPSSISSKRSFLKMTWDGMNYFFQSIVNFFNKTFSNISDFLKSSPILFALSGVFLFFLEGCILFGRGLIIESIFNNVYKGASKAYKALRLDELFLKIKQTRYNFCGKETKLKIHVEILVKNIIDKFLEQNIFKKNENNLKLFIFNYELKTFSKSKIIEPKNLKQIILDNLKSVHNNNEKKFSDNNEKKFSDNNEKKFSDNNEKKFSDIAIKLSNSFRKSEFGLKITKDTNELKSADKEKLKQAIFDKIFSSKIRAELSDLIFSELKNSLQQNTTQSSELTIDQIIQNISKKTGFQEIK